MNAPARNLLHGALDLTGDVGTGTGTRSEGGTAGAAYSRTGCSRWAGPYINLKDALGRIGAQVGDTVTLSIYVRTMVESETPVRGNFTLYRAGNITTDYPIINDATGRYYYPYLTPGEWLRLSSTYTIGETALESTNCRFEANTNDGMPYEFSAPMLTLGDTLHPWRPAPEDSDEPSDLVYATDAADVGDVSGIEGRLTAAESSITQQAGQIALKANASDVYTQAQTTALLEVKANKDTLTSEINASADTVKIDATRVNIEGAAIFTGSGRLSQDSLDNAYDANGAASAAQAAAISAAAADATSKANAAQSAAEAAAAADATSKANAAQAAAEATAAADATSKANAARDAAISAAATDATNKANAANAMEQLIYKSAAAGTSSMSGTTTWITSTADSQNAWTAKRPTYSSDYPVLFVATQRKTVGGTVTCTTPIKDDTTTVIDGGHITTGTIDASQVTVTNIDASEIKSGTIDAARINASSLVVGSSTLGTVLDGKASTTDVANAAKRTYVSIRVTAIDYSAGTATLEATLYIDGTATTTGVTYEWLLDGTTISGATLRTYSVLAATGLSHAYSCKCTATI